MKIVTIFVALICILILFLNFNKVEPVIADENSKKVQNLVVSEYVQPSISAQAYVVFDLETGKFFISKNDDESLPIASVTKLFTAAAVLNSGDLKTEIKITEGDVAAEGRSGKLEVGQAYTIRELLFPLLLESSNDAAAVFERVYSEKIKISDSEMADRSGLSPLNKSTAADLANGIRDIFYVNRYIFDITTLNQYVGTYTGWVNNSPFYDWPNYIGGKHGYTEVSGQTLTALFSEPSLDGRVIGYILLNSDDLESDVSILRSFVAETVQLQ